MDLYINIDDANRNRAFAIAWLLVFGHLGCEIFPMSKVGEYNEISYYLMFSGWQSKKVARPRLPNEAKIENTSKIFVDKDGEAPPILSQLVRYLQTKGAVENIFKITPPPGKELQTLLKKITAEKEALLLSSYTKNPHVVAELTKHYLASLPEPLLSFDFYDRLALLLTIKEYEDRLKELKEVLLRLPRGYHSTTNLITGLLSMIANSERTKMPASELAPIFVDWFIRPPYQVFFRENDSLEEIVIYLINEHDYLFKNMPIKGERVSCVSHFSNVEAPLHPRQPSIRYQEISSMNQNRKPVYYLQQVKDYQESLTKQNNQSPVDSEKDGSLEDNKTNVEKTEDSVENNLLEEAGEEEEEEEFDEEESRKTDEMMGVIDGNSESLQDEVVEETTLELEGITNEDESNTENSLHVDVQDIASNSIVLLPSVSPRNNSNPMIYAAKSNSSENQNLADDSGLDDFEMIQDGSEEIVDYTGEENEDMENFEDVAVSTLLEAKKKASNLSE